MDEVVVRLAATLTAIAVIGGFVWKGFTIARRVAKRLEDINELVEHSVEDGTSQISEATKALDRSADTVEVLVEALEQRLKRLQFLMADYIAHDEITTNELLRQAAAQGIEIDIESFLERQRRNRKPYRILGEDEVEEEEEE